MADAIQDHPGADHDELAVPMMAVIDVALLSRNEPLIYDARRMISSDD